MLKLVIQVGTHTVGTSGVCKSGLACMIAVVADCM